MEKYNAIVRWVVIPINVVSACFNVLLGNNGVSVLNILTVGCLLLVLSYTESSDVHS